MQITNSLTNTIAAAGADITLVAQQLNVVVTSGLFPTMTYEQIKSATTQASLAEIVSNYTFTFTAAASTTYSFTVKQTVGGQPFSFTAKFVSGASFSNAIIGNALVAQFSPLGLNGLNVSASVAANVITILGVAGNPVFVGYSGTNVAAAVVAAGQVAQGRGADLAAQGIAGAVAGNAYKRYTFNYGFTNVGAAGDDAVVGSNIHNLYVHDTATNFSDFNQKMTNVVIKAADFATGLVANPQAIAVG